jgi:hypothetical protein
MSWPSWMALQKRLQFAAAPVGRDFGFTGYRIEPASNPGAVLVEMSGTIDSFHKSIIFNYTDNQA